MKTKHKNAIIANFDDNAKNGKYPSRDGKGYWVIRGIEVEKTEPQLLKYHSSWNWLMCVVEKIEQMQCEYRCWCNTDEDDNAIPVDYTCSINTWAQPRWKNGRCFKTAKGKTRLKATYNAIIKFIKWYNEIQYYEKKLSINS